MLTTTELMTVYFVAADWQERTHITADARLMDVAQCRAADMSSKGYFAHQDLDGIWPNQHVRAAGYSLPDWYRDDSNQIESLASGFLTAIEALDALSESPLHSMHMRGQAFWSNHLCFGVGFSEVGERIYVVVTAPIEEVEPPPPDNSVFLPFIKAGLRDERDDAQRREKAE